MIYTLFMLLAFAASAAVGRLSPRPLPLGSAQRWFIALAGFTAAMLSAKLPFWILQDDTLHHAGAIWASGKSVLFGLVGGYFGVDLAKKYLQIEIKTGDSFVVPVAVGIGVGRLGCFFAGCCYGIPTQLSWGIVFSAVDSASRHPVQIYEAAFHLTMAAVLWNLRERRLLAGQLIKLYLLSYFAFRFLTQLIRPEIRIWLELTFYQWAIVAFIPLFVLLWRRDARRAIAGR